jgi:hypothetical protein
MPLRGPCCVPESADVKPHDDEHRPATRTAWSSDWGVFFVGCQTDWETWLVTLIQYAFGGLVSLAGAVVGLIGIGICKTRDRHETKHDVASEAD